MPSDGARGAMSGKFVACGSILGCGGSGRKKGKKCKRCAGKGVVIKSAGLS